MEIDTLDEYRGFMEIGTLDEYHDHQVAWIGRQLKNNNGASFVDFNAAMEAYFDGLISLDTPEKLNAFRITHLSPLGISKLKTTVKVYKKRQKDKYTANLLTVTVSREAFRELERIVLNTGLSKREIIERFLINGKV